MSRKPLAVPIALIALLVTVLALPAAADGDRDDDGADGDRRERAVRFATYNASLNRFNEGDLVRDLSTPDDAQARKVAEVVQRTRPDVLLVNEFDYDAAGEAADLFRENYLEVAQNGASPVDYPYVFVAPSNTGIPSGHDLDNRNGVGGPGDAFGFGFFPGQFGMVVFSRYPIDIDAARTFQRFRWADMPGAMLPDDPARPGPADWYSPEELEDVRLSSKSHWDLPIEVGDDDTVHFLVSHPTPPVFDGPEDRNGTRNHDEIRFWADYVGSRKRSRYIYDDEGGRGGLRPGARFVIAGDQNADPRDGDSVPGAVQQLLDHPRVNDRDTPASAGAVQAAATQPGNEGHASPPQFDTADFGEPPGNLRVDYVLPSKQLRIRDSAVFWPRAGDPHADLVDASDHRLVWVEVRRADDD
ncbi:endonuclease/exonuclease/phosphatase family protein [Nocardioides coralli]|uniref:endonuclease/exonuclease/phosphatase family protein n=1 Tax=Nocardioides coralli TaxID=2872154 RepID=UPI001CA3FFBF|nr:endonuclease/exonuclease/phosphatase family protein [Nocardioides coralli]QZY30140.1 endonuclease/exonuclease/phosphatase family protein [Nocardioides coralli]